ncbi:unnamed protein product [Bemisia tabaci]|uniref:TLC domain-containing protein n=1 Tax=Bemisia tabaci TaxID=7038 RepID=A0A9P0AFY8_BEMTA|nr:PREDICTED: translocating chain-associated membrane protein 1 [Bemisia tabaci]CAH0390891.1 unnamed protein product [Bemisia tabaci]
MGLKRKTTSKNPPILSHEFVIQNHADIFSCVAMVFIIGLMVQATSPLAYMFIGLSHNASAEVGPDAKPLDNGPILYTYGWKDACVVFFYFLIIIILHAIWQEYILDKVTRKLHLSKLKHNKFNESGQLAVFYLLSFLWGLDIIVKENLIFNISSLWEGYPHSRMGFSTKFFFLSQIAYWLHCYPELYFQKTKREEMGKRIRYATAGLVFSAAAYFLNFNRVGICLLMLHHLSEGFFHVARLIDFCDKEEKGSKVGYLVSNVVFVLARLGSFILSFLTFWYGLALSDNQVLDLGSGNFNIPPVRLGALVSVGIVQGYLMFHFITDQLKQFREWRPTIVKKAPAKKASKPKKKDEKRGGTDDDNELPEVDQNTKKNLRSRAVKTK